MPLDVDPSDDESDEVVELFEPGVVEAVVDAVPVGAADTEVEEDAAANV